MGWITLQQRKLSLISSINESELQDITLSRELRALNRQKSYEQTVISNSKNQELRAAKKPLDRVRKRRPNEKDYLEDATDKDRARESYQEALEEWQQDYEDAKEDYEYEKLVINEEYDGMLQELEEETTDKETQIQDEQTVLESNLESMRQELQSLNDQISSDIESQKINLK